MKVVGRRFWTACIFAGSVCLPVAWAVDTWIAHGAFWPVLMALTAVGVAGVLAEPWK